MITSISIFGTSIRRPTKNALASLFENSYAKPSLYRILVNTADKISTIHNSEETKRKKKKYKGHEI